MFGARPARRGRRDHAQRRVQRALRGAHGGLRHPDHRFEWTARRVRGLGRAGRGDVRLHGRPSTASARTTPTVGPPTQMAVLRRSEGTMTELTIPALCLVVLVGVSGSGKSTFAAPALHAARRCVSSDACRGLVADDENDQSATADAFDVLHYIVGTRLRAGLLTVVDATNVQPPARPALVDAGPRARRAGRRDRARRARGGRWERNAGRPDRDFGAPRGRPPAPRPAAVAARHPQEGFRRVHVLQRRRRGRGRHDHDRAALQRPARADRPVRHRRRRARLRERAGDPADRLGWDCRTTTPAGRSARPTRRAAPRVFVGDLVDRGPDSPGVLRLVMGMVAAGTALCVSGNHEAKLVRALQGRQGAGRARPGRDAGAARRGDRGVPRPRRWRSWTG